MTSEKEALKGPSSLSSASYYYGLVVKNADVLQHQARRQQERGQRKLGDVFGA
ncbi:hypothetical protein [Paenibacillus tyrfis]|uniref:hypothetical protein n=1 Tax=Paenibacillus tyrfis TaxID=1501230 RepID=UPI002490A8CD|nr:hypothetical protein [Paenibacillus tyrfis]